MKLPVADTTTNSLATARFHPQLVEFVQNRVLPHTNIEPQAFWTGFINLIDELTPANQRLLAIRDQLQAQIDEWCRAQGDAITPASYKTFLEEIGYLQPEATPAPVTSANIDTEIATMAGPQLVVPLKNARFALNAANARWGSLYDALYGSDVIAHGGELAPGTSYNPARGRAVVA